jgi:hypothetical protein
MIDEAAGIRGHAAQLAQRIFERCQRAGPARVGEHAPQRGRQVQPCQPRVTQHSKAAEDDEDDEGQVQQQDRTASARRR